MIHTSDLQRLARIEKWEDAADALAYLLYKGPGTAEWAPFREGFHEGIEAERMSQWIPASGLGPRAIGWTLGAVWASSH